MRLLLSFLLCALAGCDLVGEDVDTYAGLITVALVEDATVENAAVRLTAVDDPGCARTLVTAFDRGAATRTVEVLGLAPVGGASCDAVIPAVALVPLDLGPELPGGFLIEIEHAGAVDQYSLDVTTRALTLTAVRTSTTRLAE